MEEPEAANLKLNIAECLAALAGAVVAGTLWWAHRMHIELPCTDDGGCDIVAESRWAHFSIGPLHNVPIALLGFIAYLMLLGLGIFKIASERHTSVRSMLALQWAISAGGFCYSWYLQYVSHFHVGAFCPWCFTSACIMTVFFILVNIETRYYRRRSLAPSTP